MDSPNGYYMGIDPGLTGAIACYYPNFELFGSEIADIPTLTIKGKKHIHLSELYPILEPHTRLKTVICLEEPHAMPNQGLSSTFKFGRVLGQIEGVLAGLQLPYILISPATWKKRMGLTSDKEVTRAKASQLMPDLAHLWPLKKHHNRAEAMLLAYYIANRQEV